MKTPKSLYSRLALITSVTLVVGYFVVYAAWSSLTVGEVGPGATITTGLMTKIKDNFEDLNTRVSNFGFSAGNVGIGTASPLRKLHVSSDWMIVDNTYGLLGLNTTGGQKIIAQMRNDNNYGFGESALVITDGGNVGIGTASPSQKLSIGNYNTNNNIWISRASNAADSVGTIRSYIAIGINDTNETYVGTGDSHTWKIGSMVSGWVNPVYGYNTHYNDDLSFSYKQRGYAEVTALIIQGGTGNVGIGTTTPGTDKLYVNGTARGTSWTNISDLRFKKNITPITSALDTIEKLHGVTFDWRIGEFTNRNFPEGKQIGFIAQDVEKILPEVVTTDSDGYKGVEYANITAVLVEAVKEQQEQIKGLKDKNTTLEEENQNIKSQNRLIEERLNNLENK